MSLELAAKHLAAQGRGPDKHLVHMSPREVAGLQALAMAHGGSLSINPQTGLPEAGFLDKLMPMLIGAGITAATGGAAAPWMIGLGMGGFEAARTGSLSKGLMAGLGAYGGAGLGAGLMGAGAAEAASSGLAGAVPQAASAAGPAAFGLEEGLAQGAMPQASSLAGPADFGLTDFHQSPMPIGMNTGAQPQAMQPFMNPAYGAGAEGTMGEAAAQQAMAAPPITTPQPELPPPAPAPTVAPQPPEPVDAVSRLSQGDMALRQQPAPPPETFSSRLSQMGKGIESLTTEEGRKAFLSGTEGGKKALMYGAAAGLPLLMTQPKPLNVPTGGPNPYRYRYEPGRIENPEDTKGERRYFDPRYIAYAGGGPVEAMSNANAVGTNTGYPMADIQRNAYAVPYQQPMSQNVITGTQDTNIDPYTGEEKLAGGGMSHLGDYSDGGRLLKGPGDGVSDSIPAMIGNKQPARLADGEFVVPARIVSELGNGSTDAGARKLYAMMDRIQKARSKTTGKDKVAANTRAEKYMPA